MANRVVVALIVVLLTCCKGGHKEQTNELNKTAPLNDSTLIFDGKSLNGWEITNFGPQGPVYVSGGEIILGMGDGCTGITWKGDFPLTNYEVSLDAMRVDGNDFFCGMTFPVGQDPCTLIIGGWGGTTVGLSCIDGLDAAENSTTGLMSFDKKRWYHIWLSVTDTGIKAMVDSIKVVDFKTGHNRLSVRPEVELSRPFGIASWNTTAALRNIRVRRTGK
jgi:hypothetical protein